MQSRKFESKSSKALAKLIVNITGYPLTFSFLGGNDAVQ
jgi:hypothetical protein